MHPRHGGLAVRVEKLGTMTDDATVLLVRSGHESRNVDESHKWDVESVARPHEPGALLRRGDVQHAREHARLVAHDPDGAPPDSGEAASQVHRPTREVLEVLAPVDDGCDHPPHVIGLVGAVRDHVAKPDDLRVQVVGLLEVRRSLEVVRR